MVSISAAPSTAPHISMFTTVLCQRVRIYPGSPLRCASDSAYILVLHHAAPATPHISRSTTVLRLQLRIYPGPPSFCANEFANIQVHHCAASTAPHISRSTTVLRQRLRKYPGPPPCCASDSAEIQGGRRSNKYPLLLPSSSCLHALLFLKYLPSTPLTLSVSTDPLPPGTRLFWSASADTGSTLDPPSTTSLAATLPDYASLPATLLDYASTPGTSFYSNTRYLPVSSAASTNPAGPSVPLGQPPRVWGLTEGSTSVLQAFHSVPVRGDLLRVSGAHAVTPPLEPPRQCSSGSTFNLNKYECELLHLCLHFRSLQIAPAMKPPGSQKSPAMELRQEVSQLREQQDKIMSFLHNVSARMDSLASLTAPAPATSVQVSNCTASKDSRLVAPTHFRGDSVLCRGFINQCTLHFELLGHRFASDLAKVGFIMSHLDGEALT
ncbi:uncharacterized protein [Ranitomeya imitator]|uniref:uncharacterized protein n=1 Tax=Ranitomeya imitator TaxID=111125 RepID=UPI0037E7493E